MQAVEVLPTIPQNSVETAEVKKVVPQDKPVQEAEVVNKDYRIRNISAFCDCV